MLPLPQRNAGLLLCPRSKPSLESPALPLTGSDEVCGFRLIIFQAGMDERDGLL